MRWWGALALAVLVVGGASPASTAPLAYITNLTGNAVSVLYTATNTVVATVPVGTAPVGVAVNPAGTRVYVANLNSNTVSVLDTAINAVVATVPIGTAPVAFGMFIQHAPGSCVPPPS